MGRPAWAATWVSSADRVHSRAAASRHSLEEEVRMGARVVAAARVVVLIFMEMSL